MSQVDKATWDEMRRKDTGSFPRVVLLDTISNCNLKCSMCGHKSMQRPKGIMDMGLFKKIIDEIAEIDKNIRLWLVFFGEPFLLKNDVLREFLSYTKSKGLTDVVLNSNGTLLNSDKAEILVDCGLDALYIGVDATTPEVYSQIRVGGNFEKLIENIDNLLRIKKEKLAQKPVIYTQMVVMEENEHQVNDFINYWNKKGVTAKIRPKVSWAGLVEASNLNRSLEERWPCYWSMQTMSVTHDGKVVLCAVDVDARYIAGDVKNASLTSIWNGNLKNIRALQEQGRYIDLPFPCNQCLDWQSATADYYNTDN